MSTSRYTARSVTFPHELLASLNASASLESVSINQLVCDILWRGIDQINKSKTDIIKGPETSSLPIENEKRLIKFYNVQGSSHIDTTTVISRALLQTAGSSDAKQEIVVTTEDMEDAGVHECLHEETIDEICSLILQYVEVDKGLPVPPIKEVPLLQLLSNSKEKEQAVFHFSDEVKGFMKLLGSDKFFFKLGQAIWGEFIEY